MEGSDDPYEILGVPRDAEAGQIRSAYRKMALKHHPDKAKSEEGRTEANRVFAKISNAYEILSDEDKRREYDVSLRQPRQQQQQRQRRYSGGRDADGFDDGFHADIFSGRHPFFFHDPFQVFEQVFREEFGGGGGGGRGAGMGMGDPFEDFHRQHHRQHHHQHHHDPFAGVGGFDGPGGMMDPFGGGGLFGGSPFGGMPGGRRGGADPFEDMFSSMRRMQEDMERQARRGGQGASGNNNGTYFYSSSSSSSTGGMNRNGESVTTQTTTRMINGKQQTVKERIVRKADGSVEREVLEQSGDRDFPSAIGHDPSSGRHRPALPDRHHQGGDSRRRNSRRGSGGGAGGGGPHAPSAGAAATEGAETSPRRKNLQRFLPRWTTSSSKDTGRKHPTTHQQGPGAGGVDGKRRKHDPPPAHDRT